VGRHTGRATERVRIADDGDLEQLVEIETRADEIYSVDVVAQLPPSTNHAESLRSAAVVLVVDRPPIGFARVDVVDGLAHLEQLSVLPEHSRCGFGTALVEAACRWAVDRGFPAMTLITFSDVPWNAPFYASLGFVPIEDLTPGLVELRDWEHDLGLDRIGRRVVMRRDLRPAPAPAAVPAAGAASEPTPPALEHLPAT
jgi:GNAT superfamily N-acetyltransferase